MFTIGAIANVFTSEASASAGTGRVTVSAPFRTSQIIISNDTSGVNLELFPTGSAASSNQIMTIGGGESLSMYWRANTIKVSAGTGTNNGVGYRIWMLG